MTFKRTRAIISATRIDNDLRKKLLGNWNRAKFEGENNTAQLVPSFQLRDYTVYCFSACEKIRLLFSSNEKKRTLERFSYVYNKRTLTPYERKERLKVVTSVAKKIESERTTTESGSPSHKVPINLLYDQQLLYTVVRT